MLVAKRCLSSGPIVFEKKNLRDDLEMSIWLSVSLLQQVHVNRHRDTSFLRPSVSHDRFVRQGLVGDSQTTKGACPPAGRQKSFQ